MRAALALSLAAAAAASAASATKPHILLVIVDDFGWANVGYHRTPADDPTNEVQTPTMDSLCKEGIELNQSYAFWYCSPSRSAIQTGRNPIHVNVNNDGLMIHNPADPISGFAGIPRWFSSRRRLAMRLARHVADGARSRLRLTDPAISIALPTCSTSSSSR